MISNYFIDRPLFATVVSAFIVIAGLAAFRELPVAMYPNIAPPQISVSTFYPGASADVVATSATLDGLRAQVLEHRGRLDAAVRRTDFATVEREALTVRDLIVALTGRARSNLDAQQTVALEQFMHDVSENAEKLRLAARERNAEAIIPLHRELGGLVDQVLKLTTG